MLVRVCLICCLHSVCWVFGGLGCWVLGIPLYKYRRPVVEGHHARCQTPTFAVGRVGALRRCPHASISEQPTMRCYLVCPRDQRAHESRDQRLVFHAQANRTQHSVLYGLANRLPSTHIHTGFPHGLDPFAFLVAMLAPRPTRGYSCTCTAVYGVLQQ